jgi:septation ring formation regulator EzrA
MKQTILTLSIVASLLSTVPVAQARDHDRDHNDDLRSDVHSLWEWYGHLRDEANSHGGRHTRDELEGIRSNLKRVEDELNDHHVHGDRVRGEIDGIRDDLRHVNSELKWHGDVHHREGFTINIR